MKQSKKEKTSYKKCVYWAKQIKIAQKEHKQFISKGQKLIDNFSLQDAKYNKQNYTDSDRAYHIFWSNVKTLQPALYSRRPKPEVVRRYKDEDPVGRTASQILERATAFTLDSYNFDDMIKQCRDDVLITGRGQAWVRYEPYYQDERVQLTEEVKEGETTYTDDEGNVYDKPEKDDDGYYVTDSTLQYEEVKCDYVNWKDFLHSTARSWSEVSWVARCVYLTKEEIAERFGEDIAEDLKRNHADSEHVTDDESKDFRKAKIWEIWCKKTKKAYWVCLEYTRGLLDEMKDPLGLTDFFPCPKPLLATVTNDSLMPIADFLYYQDQSNELDEVSQRISLLTNSLKLAGVYDKAFGNLSSLIEGNTENRLIPVENYGAFRQKGGLANAIEFIPMNDVINTLTSLYQIRDQLKAEIYEITGVSDIIRGHSNAAETATAQQIKGQFATMRLADRQAEIQRFAKDIIALKAEIIAEKFEPETIKLISSAEQLAQTDEGIVVNIDAAIELLRNDVLRTFRIDIETDSTVAIDKQLEREQKTEFMNTFTNALNMTMQIGQSMPELMPVMAESLNFMVRGAKAGRSLESSIEKAFTDIMQAQQQASQMPPQPDPEVMKQQQEMQFKQVELQMKQQEQGFKQQIETQKQQFTQQLEVQKSQIEQQKVISQQQIEMFKAEQNLLLQRTKLDMETQLKAEKIRADQAEALIKMSNDPVMRDKPVSEQPINIVMPSGNKTTVLRTLPDGTKVAETVEAN